MTARSEQLSAIMARAEVIQQEAKARFNARHTNPNPRGTTMNTVTPTPYFPPITEAREIRPLTDEQRARLRDAAGGDASTESLEALANRFSKNHGDNGVSFTETAATRRATRNGTDDRRDGNVAKLDEIVLSHPSLQEGWAKFGNKANPSGK